MFEVEGVDYTPEGIGAVREALIEYRAQAMKQWPESIEFTLVLSHAIALLAGMVELLAATPQEAPS